MYTFIGYPKCSTCRRAEDLLKKSGRPYSFRSIVDERPTEDELRQWYQQSDYSLKQFFNTSGMRYRAEGLKDRLPQLSEDEQLKLLASDGMLVKRPLLLADGQIYVGRDVEKFIRTLD